MQSVSSRIWTRVAVSISYDDNHYTTDTPKINEKYEMEILVLDCRDLNHFTVFKQ